MLRMMCRCAALTALLLTGTATTAVAATTPHLSLTTVTAGCLPKAVWGIPTTTAGTLSGLQFYEITAITSAETTPCGPQPVNVTGSNQSALLQWNAVPGAVAYKIYRSSSPTGPFEPLIFGAGPTIMLPPSALCPPGGSGTGPRCFFQDSGLTVETTPANNAPPGPAATTQAGAHPDLRITQTVDYGGANTNSSPADPASDDPVTDNPANPAPPALKTNLFHFPSGLIANPRATRNGGGAVTTCKLSGSAPSLLGSTSLHGTTDPDEDTCPRETLVGSVQTISRLQGGQIALTQGDIYNGETLGGEPARLYIVLRPLCSAGSPVAPGSATCTAVLGSPAVEVEKSFLTAHATILKRADGSYGVDIGTFDIGTGDEEPLGPTLNVRVTANGALAGALTVQVRSLTQILFGQAIQNTESTADDLPFVTLPTSCVSKPMLVDVTTGADASTTNAEATLSPTNCGAVPFAPSTSASSDTNEVEQPVGFVNGTTLAANDSPIHQSHVRTLKAIFPRGLALNATSGKVVTSVPAVVGDVVGFSDELGELKGTLTLESVGTNAAGQFNGSIVVRADVTDTKAQSETNLVLRGTSVADPATGQLVTTFNDLPEVPFKTLSLRFAGGPNAALVNPPDCWDHPVAQDLTPWSGEPLSTATTNYFTSFDGGTGGCPSPRPFTPTVAITAEPSTAGAFTTLTTTINRPDKSQALQGFTLQLPPGMLAKLGDFPPCPAAAADTGACPQSSRVGSVAIETGTGSSPITLAGTIFFGEPLGPGDIGSLVVAIPAKVGPFDLGTVVSKAGLSVSFSEGLIRATTTGNLPTMLGGIPVRVRSLRLVIDRPGFQRNPTNCRDKASVVTMGSQGDPTTAATANERATSVSIPGYKATGCGLLPFAPKMTATLGGTGQTAAGKRPDLDVTITQAAGEASTLSAQVKLPTGVGAVLSKVDQACDEPAVGGVENCPRTTLVGSASAASTLVPGTLSGPVYLVKRTGALPKLAVLLRGAVNLRLDGLIDLVGGRLVNTFEGIPDVPLTSFKLHIDGGADGLLNNGVNLCRGIGDLDGAFIAYSGGVTGASASPVIAGPKCPTKPKLTVRVSGVRRGSPVVSIKVVRGAANTASVLKDIDTTLPAGFAMSRTKRGRAKIKLTGKSRLARSRYTIGRRGLNVRTLPTGSATRFTASLARGSVRASRTLRRRGTSQRLNFKIVVKTGGGVTFTSTVRVKPAS